MKIVVTLDFPDKYTAICLSDRAKRTVLKALLTAALLRYRAKVLRISIQEEK